MCAYVCACVDASMRVWVRVSRCVVCSGSHVGGCVRECVLVLAHLWMRVYMCMPVCVGACMC